LGLTICDGATAQRRGLLRKQRWRGRNGIERPLTSAVHEILQWGRRFPMMIKPKILLVDDNESFLELFVPLMELQGLDAIPVGSAQEALQFLEKKPVDVIVSDVQMPGMTGIELFARVQDRYPEVPFILMTAFGCTEQAVQAVKTGAFHYFEKPIEDNLDLFWTTVREALTKGEIQRELAALRKSSTLHGRGPTVIIGKSEGMKRVVQSIHEVAPLPVTVLISGDTGTGKELVARSIHELSDRSEKPFFAVNCGELASSLLESEMFGHEKGSFTGAINRRKGLFELAHQGTLFLDEISEASPGFQTKLLRVLETKTFMRVGGTTPVHSDFRILAATNRKLEDEIAGHRFRQDLYYRLNIYKIDIPPLRERKEDIPPLAEFYLKKFSQSFRRPISGFTVDALLALREYDWPGNVRELVNVIERAVITCKEGLIATKQLPFHAHAVECREISDFNLKEMEKLFIGLALKRARNNRTKASELLGISRKTLIEKIRAYGWDETAES
jgi:DNA-binding NtrC family response regulator